MDINDVQLVGGPCGQHGPYTFYKAFKYTTKNGQKKIVTLSEFFFVKMWRDSDLLCIGELQLLWTDKNSEHQTLASLRLYFLPENTPDGRADQGEDEVLAISEKVVIRMDDLITWIVVDTEWNWGRLAKSEDDLKDVLVDSDLLAPPRKAAGNSFSLAETVMDYSDVDVEREKIDNLSETGPHVIILSYPKYCRYRAMMRRLEGVENLYLKYKIVNALGGFYVKHPNTRVLFCRDTFDYPELEGHELLCNHLAPKLKGRPRGKRKKRSFSPGSESNESESSITNFARAAERANGASPSSSTIATRRSTRCHENNENKQFMKILTDFMKAKRLPMGRVPSLGYKELNLHEFYTRVQKLGGYECVTTNRLWKSIFDDMTGHLNSTSAATIIRRHYERFLLAFERYEKGEEDKPLPVSERRRLKNKQAAISSNNVSSDSESSSESPPTSRSSSSPPAVIENKELTLSGKTSSLRSIRVKPERQKDKPKSDKPIVSEDQPKLELNTTNQNTSAQTVKTEPEDVQPVIETLLDKSEEETVERQAEEIIATTEADNSQLEETVPAISIKEEEKPKSEPDIIKPSIPEGTKTEGSIPAEPATDAVAPVATTAIPENMSPVECKENIPLIKTGDIMPPISTSPEIISSHSPETPINKTVTDSFKNEDEPDEKRIKLDILKEGGLEVTPVKSTATSLKEFRPSVIQPPPNNNNNVFAKPVMAPPSIMTHLLAKRSSLPASLNITQVKTSPTTPVKQMPFLNGATPPQVVQSRSIYSYSEKTIYGNPKDVLQPSMMCHAPKSAVPTLRPGGSDPVDLSLTSPQKPAIEIMPLPQHYAGATSAPSTPSNRASVTKNLYKATQPAPILDGRKLGPNLEITLVGPKPPPPTQHHRYAHHQQQVAASPVPKQHQVHKRSNSEIYAQKVARLKSEELNSRQSRYNIPQMHKSGSVDIPSSVPSPYVSKNSVSAAKSDSRLVHPSGQKPLVPPLPQQQQQQLPPSYMASSRFPAPDGNPNNGMSPFLPIMDSLYYQAALQNVYSNLSTMPPMLPIPTAEQLKFYAELMAHGRLNLPYGHPPDGHHPSMNNSRKS